MARKNNRPRFTPFVIDLRDEVRDWVVTLTNGSGRTTVDVTGTREQAWKWAKVAGDQGGIKPGTWWPVDIQSLSEAHGEDFVAV